MSKYTLIQIQGNQQTDTGLSGKTVVQAQARTIYRLRDETGAQPHKLALWRRGQDLVLEVQGAVVTTLQGFYATGQDAAQAPHYLLDTGVPGDPWIVTGRAPQQKISAAEDLVWRLDDDVVNVQLSPEQLRQVWAQSEVQQNLGDKRYTGDDSSRREIQDLLDRWKPGATSATKAAAASKVVVDEIGDLLITGTVSAGPVFGGVTLQAWSSTGQLLGTTTIQADGSWTISAPQMGNYRGSVLLKVMDVNGVGVNYSDEVTAASKSLNTELRAIGVAQEGQTLFTVSGLDAHLIIHITPLTELAVRQAGVTGNQAPSVAAVLQANANVAQAFGLSGVNLTGPVTTTNSAGFSGVDGLSDAEKYGIALAKLSGLDALNGGNVGTSLDILAANLSGNALNATGARVLDQGRAQALAALKANSTTFNAGNGDSDTNTQLNRQLLGDIVVQSQKLDSAGRLVVSGTALAGSTVSVTLPDGSTQTASVDASGHFSLTSATAQTVSDKPLQISGTDALAAAVQNAAPKAPVIDLSNGRAITGTGEPGTTVTVSDAAGHTLGTAQVDSLGQWSLAPATPVAVGTALRATAVDANGNASGPGAGTSANAVIVRIPEASDAYVNAAEKSSDGGVPVNVSLPASAAAGDVVTTTVTRPDGSTFTLSAVLSAADISAGSVSQLIPAASLNADGPWQASTTLTHAGTTSAPSAQSFILDTSAPAAPAISPCNGQVINGTAEPGTLVKVYDGNNQLIGTVGPVGPDGNWTLVPARPLANATALHATATDLAGNTSGPGNGVVDTGALLITGAIDNVGPNTGLLFDGAVTNDNSPQLAGSLGAPLASGQSLAIYRQLDNGQFVLVGNATVNGTSWTLQDANLQDGSYTWQARVMSGATLVQTSGDFNLTVVTAAPAAPATTVPEANDHLINAAEKLSDGGVPVLTQVPANARVGDIVTTTVTLADGSHLTLTTTLKAADIQAGSISQLIPSGSLGADGVYPVSTTCTSSVTGLTSAPTDSTFVLDTTPPAAPAADVAAASDTGLSQTDKLTNDTTPDISGTGTPGDTITVTFPTGEVLTVPVDTNGNWSVTPSRALPEGLNNVTVTATDPAGNTSTPTTVPVTIDTTGGGSLPGLNLPNAPQGVNNTEAANGVEMVITLPTDATTGDVVTTMLTDPTGRVITLAHQLTADDIATGIITQTVPPSDLQSAGIWLDGRWITSTTVGDSAGNVGTAQTGSFNLAANPPTLSLNTVAGDNMVNAVEQQGDVALTGTTNAEPGQSVTIILTGPGNTSITCYAVVRPDGTFSTNLPAAAMAGLQDGSYTLTANVINSAGTPAVPVSKALAIDTAAPTITITAVAGADNVFDATERGFDTSNYTLSPTVPTPPTISGTTNAEAGQTVTVLIDGQSYSATVIAGTGGVNTWSVQVSQDTAKALIHGTDYPVTASVKDLAGNPSTPDSETLIVNIAPPDVPTVKQNLSGTKTPTVTGTAQKLDANDNPIALADDDVLTFTLNGETVTVTIDSNVGNGTDNPGVSYDFTNHTWSLNTAAVTDAQGQPIDFALTDGTYNVGVSVATGGSSTGRGDISTGELVINTVPPTLTLNAVSPDAAGDSVINAAEHNQSVTLTGTTTTEPGQIVTLTLNGKTYTATVQAGASGGPNTFSAQVSGTDIHTLGDGSATLQASVTNRFGLSGTDTEAITVDTSLPSGTLSIDAITADNVLNAAEAGQTQTAVSGSVSGDFRENDVVTLSLQSAGGTKTYTASVSSTGTWSVQVDTADLLADTDTTVQASLLATEASGNSATYNASKTYSVDTGVPGAPTLAGEDNVPGITGVIANNATTNDDTPTFSGTAEPGSTVKIFDNGSEIGSVTADPTTGAWTFTPETALTGTSHSITATATDAAGNTGLPSAALNFTLDTTAPTAPTVNTQTTSDTTPVITGTATVGTGETLTVTVSGATYTVTPAANGAWSLDLGTATPSSGTLAALSDGSTYEVVATVTDAASNASSDATTSELVIDTTAPAQPSVNALTTNDTTPVITGTATVGAGETLTVTVSGATYTVTPAANGAWSLDLGTATPSSGTLAALSDGSTYEVVATVTDAAGNASSDATTDELVISAIDTTAPTAPTVNALTTSDTTPVITGRYDHNDAAGGLTVTVAGVTYTLGTDSQLSVSAGTWTLDLSGLGTPLTAGTYTVVATATDAAGNASSDATNNELVIDTTAPAQPSVNALTTNDTTPVITGTATLGAGETLTVTVNGATYAVTPDSNGNWSLNLGTATPSSGTLAALSDGSTYEVVATATDAAGNKRASTTVSVTVDTSLPSGTLSIDAITADNVLNAAEAAQTKTAVSGSVSGDFRENDVVTLRLQSAGGSKTYTASVSSTGTWSVQVDTADLLADTDTTVQASLLATEASGNSATYNASKPYSVDTTPPQNLSVSVNNVTLDNVINNAESGQASTTLSGSVSADTLSELVGDTITIKDLNGKTFTTTVQADGSWSVSVPTSDLLADSDKIFTVSLSATDAAGNQSTQSATKTYGVDTGVPGAPTLAGEDNVPGITGVIANNATTNDDTPTFSGTAEPGSTVKIFDNGTEIGSVTADPTTGAWTFTPETALAGASHSITATATDAAGNTSLPSAALNFTLDTTAPTAPTVNALTTSDTTPVITGTATVGTGETLTVTVSGATYTVTPAANGAWSLDLGTARPSSGTLAALSDGSTYEVVATVTDAAGNASSDATTSELVIDTTAPAQPSVNALTTNDTTPVITGTATVGAGETLTVTVSGATYKVTPDLNGNWSLDLGTATPSSGTLAALSDGSTYEVVATVTDAAGNASSDATNDELVIIAGPTPDAPVIHSAAWTTTLTGDISGIPEARHELLFTTADTNYWNNPSWYTSDGVIWMSEAYQDGGTTVRVAIPTATAAVGDKLVLQVGTSGTYGTVETPTLTSTDISNGYVYMKVPYTTLKALPQATDVPFSVTLVNAAGTSSAASTVNVRTRYDIPLAGLEEGYDGFVINGESSSGSIEFPWGYSVSYAGDVNGDGLEDVIIGAPFHNNGALWGGRAYVVFGTTSKSAIDLAAVAGGSGGFVIDGPASEYGWLGNSVEAAGDLNGDGLADLFVSDRAAGNAWVKEKVFVVYGKSDTAPVNVSNMSASAGFTISNDGALLSRAVRAGDFNGDGYDDFLVLDPDFHYSYLVLGRSAWSDLNLSSINKTQLDNGVLSFINAAKPDMLAPGTGISNMSFGDINGDGLDDLVLGHHQTDSPSKDAGAVHVIFGTTQPSHITLANGDPVTYTQGFYIEGDSFTGSRAAVIGDVNGDGLADIMTTSNYKSEPGTREATYARVVFGKSTHTTVDLTNLQPSEGFTVKYIKGYDIIEMSSAGDINGDGLSDMFISAYNDSPYAISEAGRAWVVFGRTGSSDIDLYALTPEQGFRILGASVQDWAGASISNAGDFNGDGFGDLIIGAYGAQPLGRTGAGKAYVIFGGNTAYTQSVVDFAGTAGHDTLSGTTANEQFIGAQGDDTMIGGGGADVMYGGAGNDTFVLNADNVATLARNTGNDSQNIARIDGGTGLDKITLDGGGITLDLTAIRTDVIRSVEHIDISGSGNNTLILNLYDVLDMGSSNVFDVDAAAVDTRKQLMVTGSQTGGANSMGDDKLLLTDLLNWTKGASAFVSGNHTYDVYNHSSAQVQLLVDQKVVVSAS